jgi:PAT family beta-lactamase induction signal transducer AmpG
MGELPGRVEGQPEPAPAPPPRKPRNLAWVASTYFGQGFPWSFLHQMGTEYLTAVRAPIEQVGYTSWLHLATTLKFLWGPVVDMAGTKRRWMVVLQVLLGVAMLGVAAVTRASGLGMFWVSMSLLAIMHATHDIACDGYYMLALSRKDQALYSGARVAAFRVAMWVGSSVLVSLAGTTSWPLAFGAAGVLMMVVGATNALFIPHFAEPIPDGKAASAPGAATLSEAKHRAPPGTYLAAYRTFFGQPQAVVVLLFIFTFKLGDIMMFAMSKPLLRDIGIGTMQRGLIATPQLAAQFTGAILAGWIFARWGIERCLIPVVYLMNLVIPLYAVMAWTSPRWPWVVTVVVIEQFAGGMGATAQTVYLMQRCRRAFSASHYAFATAVTALGTTLSGAFSGHLNGAVGHRWYFILCFAFGIPSMILVLLVPKAALDGDEPAVKATAS